MNTYRTYLGPGTKLCFENGTKIIIDEIVGSGGTAITYYGREILEDQESVRVLVKELYPDDPSFLRQSDGTIEGKDTSAELLYDALLDALYCEQELGNQIAQKGITSVFPMKEVLREQSTGNYYGLFYQCPPSITLRKLVEKAGDRLSLCGKLKLIASLSRLVRSLHERGQYCHNDISGGNVLIISNELVKSDHKYADWNEIERDLQVGLIDFACALKLNRRGEAILPEDDDPMWSHTDGFSAPELYEGDSRDVTVKADVYSVAACLWFLLTGDVLEVEDGYPVLGEREWKYLTKCLQKHELCTLSGDVRAAFGKNPHPIPEDLIEAIIQLLERGLAESWNRFRNMEIFEERLQEILDLAEGSSVSGVILSDHLKKAYEENRKLLRNRYTIRENLLPVITEPSDRDSEKDSTTLLETIFSGHAVYAIGPGGVGKTTTMFRAAEKLYQEETDWIPVYIELNRLPMWKEEFGSSPAEYWLGTDENPMFIEQYLAGIYYGCYGKMTGRNDLVAGALHGQITRPNDKGPNYLIFLDGLNEMAFSNHEEKRAFISAINWYLEFGYHMRIILTSRYDEGLIDSEKIHRVHVSGLTDESVKICLEEELTQGRIQRKEYEKLMDTDRKSNLWKCLKLPLFLSMYCQVEDKRKLNSAGEILQGYFHDKKVELDGSRFYSERVIASEKFEEMQFSDELSMEHARRLIIDLLLPELGYRFMYQQIFFIEKKEAEQFISRCLSSDYSAAIAKRYGYTFEINDAIKKLQKVGAEKILRYICENIGLLVLGHGESYFFPHQYYRDFFAANKIIHIFCDVSEYIGKMDANACEVHRIRSLMEYYAGQDIPESILMLCGECLGVHRTVPVFEENEWRSPEKWDPLVDVMFEACRFYDKYQNLSSLSYFADGKLQKKIIHREVSKALYVEKNLFHMLCLCRRFGNRADLSGINFSGISLNHCDVRNVIFSHTNGQSGIYADLRNTKLSSDQFREGTPVDLSFKRIIAHPSGECVLVITEKEVLHMNRNVRRMHLEERELLGDEIRPMGYWDKIECAEYRKDGLFLGIVESITSEKSIRKNENFCSEETRMVHFYDRKQGKKYTAKINSEFSTPASIKVNFDRVLDCTWIGDKLVLLQSTQDGQVVHTTIWLENERLLQSHRIFDMKETESSVNCLILDEKRVLLWYDEYGVIYQTETGEIIWVDLSDVQVCKTDREEGCTYLFTESGQVLHLDIQTGEKKPIIENPMFGWINRVQISNGKVYFANSHGLFQTDTDFRSIRFVGFYGILRPENQIVKKIFAPPKSLSVGGRYAILDSCLAVRLSDGEVIGRWSDDNNEPWNSNLYSVRPRLGSIQIGILDIYSKVLYQCEAIKDQPFQCIGYSFLELDESKPIAIYADFDKKVLMTCTEKSIQSYDLNTGKKLQGSDFIIEPAFIQAIGCDRCKLKEAVFAPGGKGLEVKVACSWKKQMRLITEDRFAFIDYENRCCTFHNDKNLEKNLYHYLFVDEDIWSGIDSGRRIPLCKESPETMEKRQELMEYYMSYHKNSYSDDFLGKSLTFLEKMLFSMEPEYQRRKKKLDKVEVKLFEYGSNYCGIGKDGFFYWDEKKGKQYSILLNYSQEQNLDLSLDGNMHLLESYPIEDGFMYSVISEVVRCVKDPEKNRMSNLRQNISYMPKCFLLGCPGAEDIQIFDPKRKSHEYEFDDEAW